MDHIWTRRAGVCLIAAGVACCGSVAEADGALLHDIDLEFGLGYDSNPFLTPDEPYFDQNRREILDPRAESGFFLPVRLLVAIIFRMAQVT